LYFIGFVIIKKLKNFDKIFYAINEKIHTQTMKEDVSDFYTKNLKNRRKLTL